MKNVTNNQIMNCIYMELDQFKELVSNLTNGVAQVDYNSEDGLIITQVAHLKYEQFLYFIHTLLSDHFGVNVTSFHADGAEHIGVWICYKDAEEKKLLQFKVGNTYSVSDWFTGGTHRYKCISKSDNTVRFSVIQDEMDGVHSMGEKEFQIQVESETEYVLIYEYKGHENRLYAK